MDLFSGSGAVSWFAAESLGLAVSAIDLQEYAVLTTAAVIERTKPASASRLVDSWIQPARQALEQDPEVAAARREMASPLSLPKVMRTRKRAGESSLVFTRSYGGYYFGLEQARAIDELRASIPARRPHSTLCLAALIMAASRCSASPGHTAQPFRPTEKALPHIDRIWRRDLLDETETMLRRLAPRYAVRRGTATRGDANTIAASLTHDHLVFLDPPYSAAQYSRFYHVLEAIAVGGYDTVYGAGRSPAIAERANSAYSCVSTASSSLERLLRELGERSCRVVATFPQYPASNGLSGEEIVHLARRWFTVDVLASSSHFSTMGGNGEVRAARRQAQELVITMFPR